MTRDFNKQQRDDARSSSRNSSSGRYGEERSPRPARPRLNREAVDRAWENGAPQHHADYRTGRKDSTNRNAQPPRDTRRRDFQFDHSSAQHSPNRPSNDSNPNSGRRFGNYQDNNRRSEGTPYGNRNPRYRSTDYSVRDSGNSRINDRGGRGYSDRPGETDSPRGFRDNPRYRDSEDHYHDRNANRGYGHQGRDFDRGNRYARDFDRDNRSPRNFDRGSRPSPSRGVRGPNTQNPRWQSRPTTQRGSAYSRPGQNFPRHSPKEEQFEGDYERFDAPEAHQHPSAPGQFHDDLSGRPGQATNESPERPVTRLRDGRVLKGPRPAQRKNAQFWNDITEETEALVDSVPASPAEQPSHLTEATPAEQEKPKERPKPPTPHTPRAHSASAVVRGRKATKPETKKRVSKPRSTGPKPSQRGFKWPTP